LESNDPCTGEPSPKAQQIEELIYGAQKNKFKGILPPPSEDRGSQTRFAISVQRHLNFNQGLGRLANADAQVHNSTLPSLAGARSFRAPTPFASSLFSRIFVAALALIVIALLSYAAARRSVDFPVYHYAARKMLSRTGPMYGPQSGIGWPQVYRYPPLFLLLFIPFALLPLRFAAILWAALKFTVLGLLARSLFSRLGTQGLVWQLLSLLPALPYLAVEFHYGNVQFFIFALVAAALLCLDERPVLAALALALAISIKVAPLFFVPYLIVRKRVAVAGLALVLTAALTLLPAGYFGWHTNASLLHQWMQQELGIASTAGEPGIIGFPSQSLHSVLMRFLVSLNYAELTDANYPKLNLGSFDPRMVELLWFVLAAAGYAGLLFLARRRPQADNLTIHGVAFCMLLLLEPFTQMGDLVILFWPICIAVAALHDDADLPVWIRAALYAGLTLMVLKPLVPDRTMQRLFQVLGVDFAATCLLAAGLIGKCLRQER
jgi:glycosyl transferase family 87